VTLAMTCMVWCLTASHASTQAPQLTAAVRDTSASEARSIVELLREKAPAALTDGEIAWSSRWTQWVSEHRTRLADRLQQGDEDSVVNLWLYGTTFTQQPPARDADIAANGEAAPALDSRLEDFIAALSGSATDERLTFARDTLLRRDVDVRTAQGRTAARRLLLAARERAKAEFRASDRALRQARVAGKTEELEAHSTVFRDRGLSSDTSILVDFALERAVMTLKAGGVLAEGSVGRVAIVGPGLDVINKANGYDFYPQQSIQPFAVIDTLLRLKLANPALTITTLDVNSRVNDHLVQARHLAQRGKPYLLHLPLGRHERWVADLRSYWQRMGDFVGESTGVAAPGGADVDVRAVRVRTAFVEAVTPLSLDIVSERLTLTDDARFDLVIGTNVFVYYDPFEQALAASNVAAMLRPGGLLLSNNDLFVTAPMSSTVGHLPVIYSDRQNDNVFVYQRQ
jgi:hypothetical protein